jgi:hypothetical protein
MRRFVLAVSAIAVLLLGLEKVGVYQFVPGGDTGFQFAPLAGRPGYSLRHANGGGNLTSWVQLIVRPAGTGSSLAGFEPLDWTGDPLAIMSRPLGDGRFKVSISKRPNPPRGTPFVWGAGLELQIVRTTPGTMTLDDWAVFPSSQAPDNFRLAARRHRWTAISWVLLVLGALGTALTALKGKDAGEAVTTRTLASAIVNDIDGENPEDTKRLRVFMRKVVLEEVPVDQALTKAGFPIPHTWPLKLERFQFQARAVRLFRERVDNVVTEFERYNQRLAPQR